MGDRSRMMNLHSSILQVASMIKNNEQKKAEDSFEMEKKKRERKANYSREETDRLVELIITKKSILEIKKGGADQWQEKKQAWEDIEKAFNRGINGSNYRDGKALRIKYESLKRDVKKKWANTLAGRRNSAGRLPKFSSAEKKIKELMQLPIEEGYCDFSTMNDKSEDDDDTSISNPSDSEAKDPEWPSVKTEINESDEEDDPNVPGKKIVGIIFEPINEGEPPNKKTYEDPLVTKQGDDKKQQEIDKNLEKEKLEAVKLQKELIKHKIQLKKQKIKMLEEEIEHRRAIHELEKQRILLEIDAIKKGSCNNDDDYII